MDQGNETEVILDLGADQTDGVLQREVMARLLQLLTVSSSVKRNDTQIERRRTPDSLRVDTHHKHSAILLAGRRGEGKTTFLTGLLRRFEEGRFRDFNGADADKTPRLISLGLIDPTMLESKQNIILSVISRINDVVEHYHRLGDFSDTAGDSSYRDVKEGFAKLAQGVTVLDGVGNDLHQGENWADARFIMEHGLTRTEAAYGFRQRLDSYIRKAASYLCCPGFLLCIDDADTRFDIGQKVLEALRKYLTSPDLHVIVSGDPELMLTLVRRLQWQEMGKEYIKFEQDVHPRGARASQLDSALEHMGSLTDQYLTKVLPIDRRLRLKTLEELDMAAADRGGVKVKFATEPSKPLRDVVERIVEIVWGARYPEDRDHLCSMLLRLPIRSTLEVLRASAGLEVAQTNEAARKTLDALLQISQTDLRNADAPPLEALSSSSAASTFALIAGWFSKHSMWQTHGELSTQFADDRENRVAFSVSALVARRCSGDLGAILSFWLSFALLQDRVERQEAEIENPDWDPTAIDVIHLFEFLGMGRLERPIVQMGRLAAWDRGLPTKRQVTGGLWLSGFAVPAIRIRNHNEAYRTLYGNAWLYNPPSTAAKKSSSKDAPKELAFFEPGGRTAEMDEKIETFPEEIRAYHRRLKGAQAEGYRYGGKRQYLKRAVCNTIEDLSDGLEGAASAVVWLPYSIVLSGQGSAFGNYGFRRLLAVLIDVLNAARDRTAETAKPAVRDAIEHAMIPRSHPTPFARNLGVDASEEESDEGLGGNEDTEIEITQSGDNKDITLLTQALADWAVKTNDRLKGKTIAPKVFLSIWKRFNFAQGRLFEYPRSDKENRRYLGYMMHRSVVMFLHSVAVEALRGENLPLQPSLQNNPTHSDRLFALLLNRIDPNNGADFLATAGGALFQALFECPLWGFFLKGAASSQGDAGHTNNVRSTYMKCLAEARTSADDLFTARFTPAGKEVTPVDFDGLYDLLNSVYLQR